jgi:hypothetical protein
LVELPAEGKPCQRLPSEVPNPDVRLLVGHINGDSAANWRNAWMLVGTFGSCQRLLFPCAIDPHQFPTCLGTTRRDVGQRAIVGQCELHRAADFDANTLFDYHWVSQSCESLQIERYGPEISSA